MTDDIVTRLRQKYAGQLPICTEAANEIERLREQLAMSKHECQMADDAIQTLQTKLIAAYDDIGRCHAAIDQLEKDNPT